jgi:uncharacterized protein YbcV (DUF1398 family)
MTFVHHAAEAGVAIWTTDLQEMCVSYKGTAGATILAEPIPF